MDDHLRHASKGLLELFISGLEDMAILLADTSGTITHWHPAVQKIFGYSHDEFVGQKIDILFTAGDRAAGVPQRELEMAAANRAAGDSRWLVRSDGSPIWVEGVALALFNDDNRLTGFGKIVKDATERKASDESLSAVRDSLEQSNVIVQRWDGVIDYWTKGCERLYGIAAGEALGQICEEILPGIYPMPLPDIYRQLSDDGFWQGEVAHILRDKTPLAVANYWALVRDDDSNPKLIIRTQTDVTELSRVRHQLETANKESKRMADELERSNEELSEFARITSHDLSAPLTSAGWLVDLLTIRQKQNLDAEGQKYLLQLRQALDRMSGLIEGILAHAKVGMGAIKTNIPSKANAAFSAALENLQRDIQISHALIAHDQLPDVPIGQQAMTQLFQNLLSNAIKYVREGDRPSIRVVVESDHDMWKFAIKDNGVGIEPAWAERIFQPMQRTHTTSVPGSGIGLATCKKIVSRAGGKIWMQPQEGGGSIFFFTLPKVAWEGNRPDSTA